MCCTRLVIWNIQEIFDVSFHFNMCTADKLGRVHNSSFNDIRIPICDMGNVAQAHRNTNIRIVDIAVKNPTKQTHRVIKAIRRIP